MNRTTSLNLLCMCLKRNALVALLLAIVSTVTFAQSSPNNVFNVKTMLPTSPEAAALGKFGDVPVGYYTGTANISIPIYTIKEPGLTIPIAVQYHGGGIKVEDQATNVGLGFSLEPGGAIIQVVNGTEDKYDILENSDSTGYAYVRNRSITGAYTQGTEIGVNNWQCYVSFGTCFIGNDGTGDTYTTLTRLLAGDGQPDIYQYNFPGASGKFYINPVTHQIVLIDPKAKINFVRINDSSWSATTLDGNKFFFNALETSSTYVVSIHTGYTWKLTSIVLASGKTINFNYTNGHYSWYTYNEQYHDDYLYGLNPTGQHGLVPYLDISQHNTRNLTSITTTDLTIQFNLSSRSDLDINHRDSSKRIASIDIIDPISTKKVKSFNFSYSYFPFSTIGGNFGQSTASLDTATLNVLGRRLRLDSIQEVGYSPSGVASTLPAYRFRYDSSAVLPLKTSCARDYWGYYNGQNNANLLPDLSYFHYSGDSAFSNLPATFLYNYYFTGANRVPDTSKMFVGMLRRIVYPTGGFSDFGYESNSFSNYNYPDSAKIAATIKHATAQDKNLSTDSTSTAHLVFHGNTIIRFTNTISKGVPIQGLGFNDLKNSIIQLVRIVNGSPTILQTWQMANSDSVAFNAAGGQMVWNQDVSVPYNVSAYYVVSVGLPDTLGPQNTSGKTAFVSAVISYYDTAGANLKMSYGGGVRIASIKNYAAAGQLAAQKVIRYTNDDGSSSGLLMTPLKYYYPRTLWFSYIPPSGTACINNIYGTDTTWFMSDDGAVPFSDAAGGNIIGYSKVDELSLAPDNSTDGKHTYYYNNHVSNYKLNNPNDPDLTNGLVAKEEVQNSNLDTLQQTAYYYTDINPSVVSFTGIKIFSNWIGLDQCTPPSGMTPYPYKKYEIDFYPITSRWLLPQQKTTTLYAGGHTSAVTTNYYYNAIGQKTREESYDSKGQKRTIVSVYPYDTTGSQAQSLRDSSLYDQLLRQKVLVDTTETERVDNSYSIQSGQLVQNDTKTSIRRNPSFVNISFDQYGAFKTIQQITQKGLTTSLVWNDSYDYVIAECKNAKVSAVAYTSFEKDGVGYWAVGSATRDTTASITGTTSYNLSNGNISKSGLPNGYYILSYWSTNGPKTITGGAVSVATGRTVGSWTYYEHLLKDSTSSVTISGTGSIDELRIFPRDAQMTSYTYDRLKGISAMSAPNGEVMYYVYDDFGRLRFIKDWLGNIIKSFQYNYSNSQGW